MPTRQEKWQYYRNHLSFSKRFILKFTTSRVYSIRNDFASQYITGQGYEIGAQNSPLKCKYADHIAYIDYLSRKESAKKYNISEEDCVVVDIIADANTLTTIPTNSVSFVIANHVLEHSPNPIGALLEWLRILQTNGILFLTLPNFRSNEFDFEKSPASITHLKEDHLKAQNNQDIASEHIYEHIRVIDGIKPGNHKLTEQRFKEIVASNLHTHYHVFDKNNALEILKFIHQRTPIKIINTFSLKNSIELLFIIKKCESDFHGSLSVKREQFPYYTIMLVQLWKFFNMRTAQSCRPR